MSSHAKTGLQMLFWGVSSGLVPFPANLAAQPAAHQPPRTLGVWIEEARASPFHHLMVSGTLANPAAGLAVDVGAGVPDMVWPPMTPLPELPDSAVSRRKVFGYTLVAAFVPMMVPAMIASGSTSSGDVVWFLGGWAVTLVSVPVAAMAAGTTSVPETIIGSTIGFVAGAALGGVFASGLGDYWYSPVFSVTMAFVTSAIAPR